VFEVWGGVGAAGWPGAVVAVVVDVVMAWRCFLVEGRRDRRRGLLSFNFPGENSGRFWHGSARAGFHLEYRLLLQAESALHFFFLCPVRISRFGLSPGHITNIARLSAIDPVENRLDMCRCFRIPRRIPRLFSGVPLKSIEAHGFAYEPRRPRRVTP
jgi:hypothetical protein